MNQYKNQKEEYSLNPKELFSNKMINETIKYQKKYNFHIGENNSTWNNEADAFKHTYMQAILTVRGNDKIAKNLGDNHEKGGINRGQPLNENNMDLWNNAKGREIGNEIIKEYGLESKFYTNEKINDIIAEKVMQKMRKGELITNPNDTRIYKENKSLTEPSKSIFTPEQIGKMSQDEYLQNETKILEQYKNGEIKYQTSINDFSNYTNPISGKKRVFTREDIDKMSINEFTKYQQEIFAQSQSIGVPYKDNISKNTRTYTKDKNYFSPANGKWRTIDGNHVFIENN